ncbi:unnamed protein product [Clonostachys rosea]|uniref:Uncharacterized protein n=1 Tax=Bionectria ochroleuca TaxID=29856 RepID=A0ABY6U2B1_BIOOC|nr:unnamed protein product [Clonostachys rosea]
MKFTLFIVAIGAAVAAPTEVFMNDDGLYCWDLCSFKEPECPDQMVSEFKNPCWTCCGYIY